METAANDDIGFYCPNCDASYRSQRGQLYRGENTFECLQCRSEFSMAWDGKSLELIDFKKPVEVQETLNPCAHCGERVVLDPDFGCLKCGKFPSRETPFAERWKNLLIQFDDEVAHEQFFAECLRRGELELALESYKKSFELLPADRLIRSQILRCQAALASPSLVMESTSTLRDKRVGGVFILARALPWLPILFCLGLIILSLQSSNGENRNLAGIGGMALVIYVGLLLQFGFLRRLFF